MQVIEQDADLDLIADPSLRALIDRRIQELTEYVDHFSELVRYVVVEPGDGLADLEAVLGFSPLINLVDGVPFGNLDFAPSWDALVDHPGHYELVYVLSDDGSGVEVFISKEEGVPAQLLGMCGRYAVPEEHT